MQTLSTVAAMAIAAGSLTAAQPSSSIEPSRPSDRCLALVTTNLAKGRDNWYTYIRFSNQRLAVKPGDTLSYRVFLDPRNPEPKGGIDVDFEHGESLRDVGRRERALLRDDHGILAHGDGDLSQAKGQWLVRRIDLSPVQGRTAVSWNLVEEGDKDGRYAQFVDDVAVTHADGSRTVIYEDGPVPAFALLGNHGYTTEPTCAAISSSRVRDSASVEEAVTLAEEVGRRTRALDAARREVSLAGKFAERASDIHLKQHVEEATNALNAVDIETATPEEIERAMHAAGAATAHVHPEMEKYTGHLVGHAHIDLQWLWEWQEGICFTHDTFAQAVKFMDEFKGFTFSQSSSCLYKAMEEQYPELFKAIQQKVKDGQWEIVGGRICEGDTNMIGEESSARQFLYGQRYFRERFGKTAVVGWEPDTFGHTFQMPQMLKLAGCEYYYFCRGGKDNRPTRKTPYQTKPLFWWEGLDGTRVLAFDEPASGSWYNSDLSYQQFQEMLDFDTHTGSKDMLWVYGVGNHGGGPTREHINWALEQMKSPSAPKVRFSTATEFFQKLSSYDLTKIPVVHEELNPVFEGCYTTHADVKQLNRRAEAMTTSAEAVATVASLTGFAYPSAEFRRNWEDICFNHHHDTLPGTGIHPTYARTHTMLERVIADDRDIITRAMEHLVVRVRPKDGGANVLVFNPTGWTRSEWVETTLVRSGWDRTDIPDPAHCVAIAPDGKQSPVTLIDPVVRTVRFKAEVVPPFGYRVFHLASGEPARRPIDLRDDGATVETDSLIVEFDRSQGGIKRLMSKAAKLELCTGGQGRLEAHWEEPKGSSAWTLGKVNKIDALKPASASFARGVDFAEALFTYTLPAWNKESGESRITQRFRVLADSDQIECDIDCDWRGVGTPQSPNAMLRVAFDVGVDNPIATYHVPFGALSRPTDGNEYPALQWADVGDGSAGITILNDSKHGFASKGSTLTMGLIRSTFQPDPLPNPGPQHWRYAIVPHAGDWRAAHAAERGAAFNQALLAASVPYDASGPAPLEWALLKPGLAAIPTGLKRTEEGTDLVLRMYDATGSGSEGTLAPPWPIAGAEEVNFIEDVVRPLAGVDGVIPLKFRPFEIKTLRFHP